MCELNGSLFSGSCGTLGEVVPTAVDDLFTCRGDFFGSMDSEALRKFSLVVWNTINKHFQVSKPNKYVKLMEKKTQFITAPMMVKRYIFIFQGKQLCHFHFASLFNKHQCLAPNKHCSRQHFNFLLLSFEENKA